jgi:hypothetical protein
MPIKLGKAGSIFIGAALLAGCAAGVVWFGNASTSGSTSGSGIVKGLEVGAAGRDRSNSTNHPVLIKRPAGAPRVATRLTNFHGEPVTVACSSCHATTKPNSETRTAAELDQFHQGLKYVHGNLTCLSCHNANNYDTLHLADSRPVEFTDGMTLCSQCHGPQRRDYDMGLHGGMTGHWDLTRGGRTRNTCINCHDPHAPAFPLVLPVFPPRDRISVPGKPGAKPTEH